jgi:large subunit ribosomal protein L32
MRRSQHDKVAPKQYITCQNCGEVSLPHRACGACGFYKGKLATIIKGN